MDFTQKLGVALDKTQPPSRPTGPQIAHAVHNVRNAMAILDPFNVDDTSYVAGSPDYIPPEIARGDTRYDADLITDLYYRLQHLNPHVALLIRPLAIRFQSLMRTFHQLSYAAEKFKATLGNTPLPKAEEPASGSENTFITTGNANDLPGYSSIHYEDTSLAKRLDTRKFSKIGSGVAKLKSTASKLGELRSDPEIGKFVDEFLTKLRDFLVYYTKLAPTIYRIIRQAA